MSGNVLETRPFHRCNRGLYSSNRGAQVSMALLAQIAAQLAHMRYRAFGARLAKSIATYSPAFLVLLLPAFFNGFPLLYPDSGTYLAAAIQRAIPVERPIHYSVFLCALHLRQTLWPAVFAQATLTIAVLGIFLEASLGRLRALHMAAILAALSAVSALPVVTSELIPDLFTPLLICSLAALALHSSALTNVRRVFLYAVVLLSICVHQTNFLVACALLSTLAVARSRLKPSLAGPALAVCAGFGLLVAPNVVRYHSVTPTMGSSVFLLANLLDEGIGLDYLDKECKNSSFSICAELPALHEYRRNSPNGDGVNFFLWGGPLAAVGGVETVRKYAGSVDARCILRYPGRFILASVRNFGRQSVALSTGEGIGRFGDEFLVCKTLKSYFPPEVYDEFQRSRQQSGTLHFARISKLHIGVVILSVAILGVFAKRVYTSDKKFAATVFMLLAGFLANALVAGTFGHPVNRFQSRVSWLIPLAAIMTVYRQRRAGERGSGRTLP